jgi:hypothetical protein
MFPRLIPVVTRRIVDISEVNGPYDTYVRVTV